MKCVLIICGRSASVVLSFMLDVDKYEKVSDVMNMSGRNGSLLERSVTNWLRPSMIPLLTQIPGRRSAMSPLVMKFLAIISSLMCGSG